MILMAKRHFNLRKFPNHVFNSPFLCPFSMQPLFYKKKNCFFFSPLFYRMFLCQFCFYFQNTRFDNPVTLFTDDELEKMELRYYNAEVHKTAFTLPQFAKKVISFFSCHGRIGACMQLNIWQANERKRQGTQATTPETAVKTSLQK